MEILLWLLIGFAGGLILGATIVFSHQFKCMKCGYTQSPNDTMTHSTYLELKNRYEADDKLIVLCEFCNKPCTFIGHGIGYECLNKKCTAPQDLGFQENAKRRAKSKKGGK